MNKCDWIAHFALFSQFVTCLGRIGTSLLAASQRYVRVFSQPEIAPARDPLRKITYAHLGLRR